MHTALKNIRRLVFHQLRRYLHDLVVFGFGSLVQLRIERIVMIIYFEYKFKVGKLFGICTAQLKILLVYKHFNYLAVLCLYHGRNAVCAGNGIKTVKLHIVGKVVCRTVFKIKPDNAAFFCILRRFGLDPEHLDIAVLVICDYLADYCTVGKFVPFRAVGKLRQADCKFAHLLYLQIYDDINYRYHRHNQEYNSSVIDYFFLHGGTSSSQCPKIVFRA